MTEDEAKKKWCPHVRTDAQGPENSACNRYDGTWSSNALLCIGSACMAWRWEDEDAYEQRLTEWEDAANIGGITDRGPEPVRGGFCGLAGKP